MSLKLYGIPNCDTVKKARSWLQANQLEVEFNDFKKQGVTEAQLTHWLNQLGWKTLLKKTGPSWSKLSPEDKASLVNDAAALRLMLQNSNLIKRPILEQDGKILATGFNLTDYENLKL